MSLADVILRSDHIYKKYEKYEGGSKQRQRSDDPWTDEYMLMLDKVQDLHLKAEQISVEQNRAQKAAANAELRRSKAMMLEQALPVLVELARGTKKEKLAPHVVEDRMMKIEELRVMIMDVPDGVHPGTRRPGGPFVGGGGAGGEITIDSTKVDGRQHTADYYKHTEETAAFQAEWEEARQRQDMQLDNIETGLGTLKEIGLAMNEELQRHDVLIDEAEDKMDAVTKELANNNMRLKGLVYKVRRGRNFIIDVILICILCGIGGYIYYIVAG